MDMQQRRARLEKAFFQRFSGGKIYPSYTDAAARCSRGLYENTDILEIVKTKARQFRTDLNNGTPVNINIGVLSLTDAICRMAGRHPGKRLRIIDFGGGDGGYYLYARKLIPENISLQWQVVETEKMVAAMREFETAELSFSASLQEAAEKSAGNTDIIFTSCTLQYTPDPCQMLEALLDMKSSLILFNRQSLSLENFDVISIQASLLSWHGYGPPSTAGYRERVIRYPHTSIRQQKFEEMIGRNYHTLYTFDEPSGTRKAGRYRTIGKSYCCLRK
ncbi:methyltransferase, TIGR04325 family [Compostibacter hankyongensis]|uniref:Methyltransferase, TIGR04325 family n=1 Tax=Compostibacter hankyongensis TaxID=1007089 RepID=A0ABP8G5T2_9BACT